MPETFTPPPGIRYSRAVSLGYPESRLIAAEHCDACGAEPYKPCDGSRIPRFEDWHFTRREAARNSGRPL